MCTLSCVPGHALAQVRGTPVRFRVVFSRDEHRTRLPAVPPAIIGRGARRVLMPRDAEAGGTWIAANDAGVVFALLNVNAADEPALSLTRHLRTRGAVIEHLVESISAADALERMRTLGARAFRPFRVLAFDRQGSWMEVVWSGVSLQRTLGRLAGPTMRASSGLGDRTVIGPRESLFETLVQRDGLVSAAAQDQFHRHHWTGREAVSVRMSRPDARTVSITTVEVRDGVVRMFYDDVAECTGVANDFRGQPSPFTGRRQMWRQLTLSRPHVPNEPL